MIARRLVMVLLAGGLVGSLPVFAADEPVRVAMLPVVVHSASGASDYLSKGIADMLAARLETGGGVQVIRLTGESYLTSDARKAVQAGAEAQSDFVVFGSFTQFGSGASLDVRCARVEPLNEKGDPESRRVFVQSGDLSEIIPRLDDLAGKIVKFVKSGGEEIAEVAATQAPVEAAPFSDLERRIEVLEEAVFRSPTEEVVIPEPPAEEVAESEDTAEATE